MEKKLIYLRFINEKNK